MTRTWSCTPGQIACATIWSPSVAEERLGWSTEAVALARTTEEEQAFVVSSTLRTVVLGELGRAEEMAAAAAVTRAEAERLRIPYGELVLGAVTMPWLALGGRFEECAELLDRMQVLAGRVNESFAGESVVAAQATIWMWQGEAARAAELLHGLDQEPYQLTALVAALLWRAGEPERAAQHLDDDARERLRQGPGETPLSLYLDCHAAELSLRLGDQDMARRCHDRIAPYAGRTAQAGSALNAGPVDTFLALAAAAMGERAAAIEHVEAALELTDRWRLRLARSWIEGLREEHGF